MELREPLYTFILIIPAKHFVVKKREESILYRLLACTLLTCVHRKQHVHQFILGLGGCQRAKVWSCFDQEFLVCSLGWKFIQLELLCVGRPLLSTYYCSLLRREKKQGGHFQNDHTTISWNHWTIFDVPPLVDQILLYSIVSTMCIQFWIQFLTSVLSHTPYLFMVNCIHLILSLWKLCNLQLKIIIESESLKFLNF